MKSIKIILFILCMSSLIGCTNPQVNSGLPTNNQPKHQAPKNQTRVNDTMSTIIELSAYIGIIVLGYA